jgi:histidine triad (HIT) family protein
MKTFEDIVTGRVPARVVFQDERHLAFLSPRPIRPGHVIVLPKRVVAYVFDMDPQEYAELWAVARDVARRVKESLACERVCVAVIGWEVRHVHVHLVPTNAAGEFPPLPGLDASDDELDRVHERLRSGQ